MNPWRDIRRCDSGIMYILKGIEHIRESSKVIRMPVGDDNIHHELERFAILAAEVFEENIFKDNWVFWSTFTGIDKNERWPGPNQVCIGPL